MSSASTTNVTQLLLDWRAGKQEALDYFGGLSNDQVAEALGISRATVQRELRLAKAWLNRR